MVSNWEDLRTILALVRQGTLSGAATELGVNYTTVARRIQRAEASLGQILFERLADGYRVTEVGRYVADRAAAMERTETAMLRTLQGQDDQLRGPLVITVPQLLLGEVLGPVLNEFSELHPDVDLQFRATNDLLDLDRREADLALRISRTPGDNLKGIRLTDQHSASFCTPELARHIENDPDAVIDWVVYASLDHFPQGVSDKYGNHNVKMRFDDMVAIQGAARAGLGVARMPMFLGRKTPGLFQVDVLPPQAYAPIWIVGHPDVWPNAKAAAFRAEIVRFFKANRSLFVA